jgi:hypothetical protein
MELGILRSFVKIPEFGGGGRLNPPSPNHPPDTPLEEKSTVCNCREKGEEYLANHTRQVFVNTVK